MRQRHDRADEVERRVRALALELGALLLAHGRETEAAGRGFLLRFRDLLDTASLLKMSKSEQ